MTFRKHVGKNNVGQLRYLVRAWSARSFQVEACPCIAKLGAMHADERGKVNRELCLWRTTRTLLSLKGALAHVRSGLAFGLPVGPVDAFEV